MQPSEHHPVVVQEDEDSISLLDLMLVLARRKKLLFWLPLTFALLGGLYAFTAPKIFEAKTTLMPPQQQQSAASAMLSQLGGLAGAAGGALGLKNPNDLYIAMLQSKSIGERLADRFKLQTVYEQKTKTDTLKTLTANSAISSGKDGLISIAVQDKSPQRAAQLANAYVEELRHMTRTLAVTEAQQRRLFFEQQLHSAKEALAEAEVAMKALQEKTGVVQVEAQGRATIEALAQLRAQIAAKQVQLNAMRTFATGQNPDYQRVQSELSGLQAQMSQLTRGRGEEGALIVQSKAPGLGLDYIRKMRDVKYNETLFEIIAKQYEIARMDEAKEGAVIQVIDPAVPPEHKVKPKRGLIIVLAGFAGLLFSILLAFILEALKNAAHGPDAGKLRELRAALRLRGSRA